MCIRFPHSFRSRLSRGISQLILLTNHFSFLRFPFTQLHKLFPLFPRVLRRRPYLLQRNPCCIRPCRPLTLFSPRSGSSRENRARRADEKLRRTRLTLYVARDRELGSPGKFLTPRASPARASYLYSLRCAYDDTAGVKNTGTTPPIRSHYVAVVPRRNFPSCVELPYETAAVLVTIRRILDEPKQGPHWVLSI